MDSDFSHRSGAVVAIPTVRAAGEPGQPDAPWARGVFTGLTRLLAADGPTDYRRAFYALAGVLAVFFTLAVSQGPCLQLFYGHDDLIFLAAAWKIRNGIFPHADCHIALGALGPWVYAAGLWALGPTAFVLPLCNSLVAAATGLLAWTVAARRLPAALAAGFAGTQFIVAMTPHLLRFSWFAATYDGCYNRQCYALVATLALLFFLPRREPDERAEHHDDLLAGVLLGALLFMKVSYFMAGVGLCGWAFVLGGRFRRRRLPWGLALGFGAVFLLCLPLVRFDLPAMLADLRMAAAARSADPRGVLTMTGFFQRLSEAWVETAALAAVQFLLRPPGRFRRTGDAPAPSWAEFAGVMGASAFLCMTNSPGGQHSETPLLTSWVFVLLGCLVRRPRAGWRQRDLALACSLAAVIWVYTFGNGFACLCWATSPVRTAWQQAAWQRSPAFDSDSLADLRIFTTGGEPSPVWYAHKVNDGLRLLRALGGTHRVEALDFVNPFPFALQWPVTRGGMWAWHLGFTFSPTAHPSAEEVFGDIDVVMVPKQPGEINSCAALRAVYGPYINARYRLVAESNCWYLMCRR